MQPPIIEEAPAKINLALHVTGRRADGYHDLDMLVAFAGIGDSLEIAPSDTDRFRIDGTMAAGLADATDNLVLAALRAFRAWHGGSRALDIRLTKRLPVASGIGGGSADAAAALRALCRLEGIDPGEPAVTGLALALGADVPMCLAGRPARVRGVGEIIEPTAGALGFGLLLVNPGVGVSTPTVFRALGRRDNPPLPALPVLASPAALAGFLATGTRNDLEAPARAVAPVIGDVLAAVAALPRVRLARMSGSGATCFGLFDDRRAAEAAGARLAADHPEWWVAASEARI